MKYKNEEYELEGTPEEIKEFINIGRNILDKKIREIKEVTEMSSNVPRKKRVQATVRYSIKNNIPMSQCCNRFGLKDIGGSDYKYIRPIRRVRKRRVE